MYVYHGHDNKLKIRKICKGQEVQSKANLLTKETRLFLLYILIIII